MIFLSECRSRANLDTKFHIDMLTMSVSGILPLSACRQKVGRFIVVVGTDRENSIRHDNPNRQDEPV